MLFVFQVDTGTMMTFDMKLVTETVANLKKSIAIKTDIPEDKQVLLISGGESLANTERICSYHSAGTDTSPIFLFAKVNIEAQQPPHSVFGFEDDTDMMEMIESCLAMQPSLDTLVARTELAADLNGQAAKLRETCEKLVHDQHLQQQGWAAVTANLEDLTRAFKNKSERLLIKFNDFTKCKSKHEELLKKFSGDMKQLDAVPILPTLFEVNKLPQPTTPAHTQDDSTPARLSPVAGGSRGRHRHHSMGDIPDEDSELVGAKKTDETTEATRKSQPASNQDNEDVTEMSGVNNNDDGDSTATTNEEDTKQSEDEFLDANQETDRVPSSEPKQTTSPTQLPQQTRSESLVDNPNLDEVQAVTLRQWIDFNDSHNSLDRLVDLCWRGIERFNDTNAEQIQFEVQELLKSAMNSNMKEIKGLEERLFGLEKLMEDAKKVVDEQRQLASSFQMNRERFSKIKDLTLLPDLSASHKQQLQMMLANHKKMNDFRDRCLRAKHELSVNLHARLKWIMYIEQQISDLDGKLMIYRENLVRTKRHFEIIEQVHEAPELYLSACVEALRRRRFSKRYLHWTHSVAKISQELYENEMSIRKEFDAKLANHFLASLFPGLTRSYPPPFATKQPDPFDTKLPRITAADIQYLQTYVCDELATNLFIPQTTQMPRIVNAHNNSPEGTAKQPSVEEDLDEERSLNPTPPSSPMRQLQIDD